MDILLVAILGGIFIADSVAAGQVMVSRPIFCAPVIGYLAGDMYTGLLVGVIMELVWINVIPLGTTVPPDATVVAVSAAYLSAVSTAVSGQIDYGFLVFVILCLIPTGIIFKKLDIIHRKYNSYICSEIEEKIRENDLRAIDRGIYTGWLLFIIKGALFLAVVIFAGRAVLADIYGLLGEKAHAGLNSAFYLMPAVGLGAAVTTFTFKKSKER